MGKNSQIASQTVLIPHRKQPLEVARVVAAQPWNEGAGFDARLSGAVGGLKEEEWLCV